MRAVILAGGKGTRLRPYTTVLPKPLLPVGDRPVLELILRQLATHGFHEIDLCVGHLGQLIKAYFDEGASLPDGLKLSYHWEDEPLGTAGALKQLPRATASFLVMNGDIVTTLDYGALMSFHEEQGAQLTIAAHRKRVALELGVIERDAWRVTGYREKPTLEYDVSMGIYVYEPDVVTRMPDGHFDFPEVVAALLALGEKVVAYPFDGEWYDIGTPSDHERATAALARLERTDA